MTNLYESLKNFTDYIDEARHMGIKLDVSGVQNIIVSGMGGSAISGNILRDYLKSKIDIPINVNRNYDLPEFADENTLLFLISYSGKTEETLSAFESGKDMNCKIVFITSNKDLGIENKIKVPEGLLPRASLPYLFIPIIKTLEISGLISDQGSEIDHTIDILKEFDPERAKILADRIRGRIPIIYSSDNYSSISYRWQTELNENSKTIAHHNIFTELNHNEIEGNFNKDFFVVVLKDEEDKSSKQIEITKKLIDEKTNIKEIELVGKGKLAKLFYGIYFGDWVSYYLAELKNVSPEKMDNINRIKKELG
ncbi:MAG: bifunctional phosphoglucose/phosphomannose isomerase [Candidatus Aenigmatarchaeota archaeon]